MADNTALNAGAGGDTIASDDILGVKFQRVKLTLGADGANDGDVSSSNPLPVAALAAGTNNIGDVDVLTVNGVAPAFGSGVRGATVQRVTIATDDAVPVTDNGGSLTVDGTVTAQTGQSLDYDTGAGTQTTQIVGVALPAAGGPVAGGTSTNPLRVDPTGTTAQPITDNAGSLTVDGTVTANLAAGTNNIGDVDVLTVNGVAPAFGTGVRGATVQRVTVATDDVVPVSQSGTWTVQPGNTANTTAWKVDGSAVTQPVSMATNTPLGTVAHDAADSGAPLKIGVKAIAALSGATLVAAADRTDLYAGVDGVLIIRPHANLEDVVQERTTNTDGASTAFAGGLAAPGAGVRLWVTQVTLCNSSASFGTVDLRDGSAGSVLWTLPVPATGGCIQQFNPPLKLTANTALAFDASAAITTLTISVNAFKSKV